MSDSYIETREEALLSEQTHAEMLQGRAEAGIKIERERSFARLAVG
jgi:hypothetical protein